MEVIDDSDEDTLMVVEEETVIELNLNDEEIYSENSSDEEQLPTLITHGKMTIRTANNANENLNEKLRLIKSLEHPALRRERLGRRSTYRNLNITKNKHDEYDKIIRNASEFLSGIFKNSTRLCNMSEENFDETYLDTAKYLANEDNSKNDDFTFGTYSRPDTKVAENKTTCMEDTYHKPLQKDKRKSYLSQAQTQKEGQKCEKLYTIKEASDLKSTDDTDRNEISKRNTMGKENKAKISKLNLNECEDEFAQNELNEDCSRNANMQGSKILFANPDTNQMLHNRSESSFDNFNLNFVDKDGIKMKQKCQKEGILAEHELDTTVISRDSTKETNKTIDEFKSRLETHDSNSDGSLRYLNSKFNDYDFYPDWINACIKNNYEIEICILLASEETPDRDSTKQANETIEDFANYDEKSDASLRYLNFKSKEYDTYSELIDICIKEKYNNEVDIILASEEMSDSVNLRNSRHSECLGRDDYDDAMVWINESIKIDYIDITKYITKIENSLYNDTLHEVITCTNCEINNPLYMDEAAKDKWNEEIEIEDNFLAFEENLFFNKIMEEEYHEIRQIILDSEPYLHCFMLPNYKGDEAMSFHVPNQTNIESDLDIHSGHHEIKLPKKGANSETNLKKDHILLDINKSKKEEVDWMIETDIFEQNNSKTELEMHVSYLKENNEDVSSISLKSIRGRKNEILIGSKDHDIIMDMIYDSTEMEYIDMVNSIKEMKNISYNNFVSNMFLEKTTKKSFNKENSSCMEETPIHDMNDDFRSEYEYFSTETDNLINTLIEEEYFEVEKTINDSENNLVEILLFKCREEELLLLNNRVTGDNLENIVSTDGVYEIVAKHGNSEIKQRNMIDKTKNSDNNNKTASKNNILNDSTTEIMVEQSQINFDKNVNVDAEVKVTINNFKHAQTLDTTSQMPTLIPKDTFPSKIVSISRYMEKEDSFGHFEDDEALEQVPRSISVINEQDMDKKQKDMIINPGTLSTEMEQEKVSLDDRKEVQMEATKIISTTFGENHSHAKVYNQNNLVLETTFKSDKIKENLISKIEENIEVIDLYERRIKSMAQTIINHESDCEENIKNMPSFDWNNGRDKDTKDFQTNVCFPDGIVRDFLLILFLVLLGLVLLDLPYYGGDDPYECGDGGGDGLPRVDSCALDGYRLLASQGFM